MSGEPGRPSDWSDRRLHFVGIGGAGMSGLALVAAALGAAVTGSDRAESSYTARLREPGIDPAIGHAADNVPRRRRGRVLDRGRRRTTPSGRPPRAESFTAPTCWREIAALRPTASPSPAPTARPRPRR